MRSVMMAVGLLVGISGYSEEIEFQKFTSLEAALEKSKKEKKPILVDTWATWCGWCTFMDENIFSEDEVAAYFNANFIPLKLDADGNNSGDFMTKYEISGLPALLIIDENGTVLSRSDGAITDADDFIEFGQIAYYKLYPETAPWFQKEKEFKAGNRDPFFLYEYALSLLQVEAEEDKVNEVNELYWESTATLSLEDSINFLMFYIFIHDFSNPLIDSFVSEREKLIAQVGEDTYYDKGIYIIQVNLDEAMLEDDEKRYSDLLAFTKRLFADQSTVDYDELLSTIKRIWNDR